MGFCRFFTIFDIQEKDSVEGDNDEDELVMEEEKEDETLECK